jgi:sec-independent protein translocase protein TatA
MTPLAFAFGGPWDIAIVAGVVVLLFGGSKLAGFGKHLGDGIKEFKNATQDDDQTSSPTTPASTTVVSAGKTEEN